MSYLTASTTTTTTARTHAHTFRRPLRCFARTGNPSSGSECRWRGHHRRAPGGFPGRATTTAARGVVTIIIVVVVAHSITRPVECLEHPLPDFDVVAHQLSTFFLPNTPKSSNVRHLFHFVQKMKREPTNVGEYHRQQTISEKQRGRGGRRVREVRQNEGFGVKRALVYIYALFRDTNDVVIGT